MTETAGRSCSRSIRVASSLKLIAVRADNEEHAAHAAPPAMACPGFLCDGDQDPSGAQHRPGTGHGLTANRVDQHIDITDLVLEPA